LFFFCLCGIIGIIYGFNGVEKKMVRVPKIKLLLDRFEIQMCKFKLAEVENKLEFSSTNPSKYTFRKVNNQY